MWASYPAEANFISLDLKNLIFYKLSAYTECIRLTLENRIYFRYADFCRKIFDPCRADSPLSTEW